VTLQPVPTAPEPAATAVDVWVDGDLDPAVLATMLEAALASSTAQVAAIELPTDSLWPLPAGATTNRIRVRVVIGGDDHEVGDVLGSIATVAPWSLVHRVGAGGHLERPGPPTLH
jgi:uncharacterized protein YfaQ (DUF2300 family)